MNVASVPRLPRLTLLSYELYILFLRWIASQSAAFESPMKGNQNQRRPTVSHFSSADFYFALSQLADPVDRLLHNDTSTRCSAWIALEIVPSSIYSIRRVLAALADRGRPSTSSVLLQHRLSDCKTCPQTNPYCCCHWRLCSRPFSPDRTLSRRSAESHVLSLRIDCRRETY